MTLNPESFETTKSVLNRAGSLLLLMGFSSDLAVRYLLAFFLLKVIEERWWIKYEQHQFQAQPDEPKDTFAERVNAEYLHIPAGAFFSDIAELADSPDIAEIIEKAIYEIERANPKILAGAFEGISFSGLSEAIRRAPRFFRDLIKILKSSTLFNRPFDSGVLLESYHWICARVDSASSPEKIGEMPPELGLLLAEILQPQGGAEIESRIGGHEILRPHGSGEVLQPHDGDEIYDPVCRSGGLLIACGRRIRAPGNIRRGPYTLCGQDIRSVNQVRARVSALIVGEGYLDVRVGDFFKAPAFTDESSVLKKFDIVVTQGSLTVDGYGDLVTDDPFGRFRRGIPPKARGDYVLLSHMVESLKDDTGRGAAIFTQGVLFREGAEAIIRQQLVEENLIDAVIELPPKLIAGMPQSTVIVVLRKSKADPHILFINASMEFEAGKSQNRLPASAIEKISSLYKNRNELIHISRLVSVQEVRSHNYTLQTNRYIDSDRKLLAVSDQDILPTRDALMQELRVVSGEIDKTLANFLVRLKN